MYKTQRAFSLIELLVVCCLIFLLGTLGFAHSSFLNKMVVRGEAKKLYQVCSHLRSKALATQSEHTVTFDTKNNFYFVDGVQEKLPRFVQFGFLSGTKGPPSTSTIPITSAITFKKNRILFGPSGKVQAGTVYLVDKNKKHMYALSSPVSHIPLLRIYYHDGKKWRLL